MLEQSACFVSYIHSGDVWTASIILASPRVEHMNQNMPIFPISKETFAKYFDIPNR